MKPQAAAYLEKSRAQLAHAEKMLAIDLNEDAGRTAYLAGYHSAQALIFEREGRVLKTHNGVQGEFARLAKSEAGFDVELRAFLGRTYQLKAIADYETGPYAEVTQTQASRAITDARRFVAAIERLIENA